MLPGLNPAISLFFAVTCSAAPTTAEKPADHVDDTTACFQPAEQQLDIMFGRTIQAVDAPIHHLLRSRSTV